MSSETNSPFEISKKRNVSMPLALLISALTLATAGGVAWANLKSQVDEIPAMKMRLEDHDKALNDLKVMGNDIQWIKNELRNQRREGAGNNSARNNQ